MKPYSHGTSNRTSTIPELVSVIIPTYNRSEFLARSISSVLAQTYPAVELIVVDDGSTENISETVQAIAKGAATVVRRHINGGAAAARNSGCEAAAGRFIAFLNSDDEWLPQKLETQISYLERHPEIALCCTAFYLIRKDGRSETRTYGSNIFRLSDLAFGCGVSPGSTLVFRRDLFVDVGPFDEALERLEDWDWLLRSIEYSAIGLIDRPFCNVFAGAPPSEQEVLNSTRRINARHGRAFLDLGVRHYFHFRAGLLHEKSAAAYGAGKYVFAFSKLVLSFIVYPVGKRSLIARLIRVVSSARVHRSGRR